MVFTSTYIHAQNALIEAPELSPLLDFPPGQRHRCKEHKTQAQKQSCALYCCFRLLYIMHIHLCLCACDVCEKHTILGFMEIPTHGIAFSKACQLRFLARRILHTCMHATRFSWTVRPCWLDLVTRPSRFHVRTHILTRTQIADVSTPFRPSPIWRLPTRSKWRCKSTSKGISCSSLETVTYLYSLWAVYQLFFRMYSKSLDVSRIEYFIQNILRILFISCVLFF